MCEIKEKVRKLDRCLKTREKKNERSRLSFNGKDGKRERLREKKVIMNVKIGRGNTIDYIYVWFNR